MTLCVLQVDIIVLEELAVPVVSTILTLKMEAASCSDLCPQTRLVSQHEILLSS